MYILLIARSYPSDKYPLNGIFEFDQAKALAETGCKVVFAAIDLRSVRRWRKWGIEHFCKEGVEVYTINIPLGKIPHIVLSHTGKAAVKILYHTIKKDHGEPDIIHSHFLEIAEIALALKPITKAKFAMTEHSSTVNVTYKELNNWIIKCARDIYSAYDVVITVSQTLSNRLKSHFNINPIVIPNMLDPLFISSPAEKTIEEKSIFRFVFVGNLIRGKCPLLCISAFNRAFAENSFCVNNHILIILEIIGDGPLYFECKDMIKKLGLEKHIRLLGRLSRKEIAKILKKSNCFVLPSKAETFGVVYIEAMACGLPVIATKCGGPELFVNETNGVLIPVDDQDALANSFRFMLNNAGKYDRENIANETKSKFSPDAVAEQIIAIYRGLINANSSKKNLI